MLRQRNTTGVAGDQQNNAGGYDCCIRGAQLVGPLATSRMMQEGTVVASEEHHRNTTGDAGNQPNDARGTIVA